RTKPTLLAYGLFSIDCQPPAPRVEIVAGPRALVLSRGVSNPAFARWFTTGSAESSGIRQLSAAICAKHRGSALTDSYRRCDSLAVVPALVFTFDIQMGVGSAFSGSYSLAMTHGYALQRQERSASTRTATLRAFSL